MSLELRVRPGPGLSDIDTPVTYTSGPFAGRKIRAQLVEVQKADLGRKYVRKDRRPLDPPPIVQMRLFEVFNQDIQNSCEEEILSCDDVMSYGFLCHLDLFPVPSDGESDGSQPLPVPMEAEQTQEAAGTRSIVPAPIIHAPAPASWTSAPLSISCVLPPPLPPSFSLMGGADQVEASSSANISRMLPSDSTQGAQRSPGDPGDSATMAQAIFHPEFPSIPGASSAPAMRAVDVYNAHESNPYSTDVVAYYGDRPVRAISMCTHLLAGTTFKDSSIIDLRGRRSAVFVFSDVAARQEGMFFLRYRVFYIFAQAAGSRSNPVIAECFGQPFKVYSTKGFPGLHASTDLTKVISMSGIRTNIRARERKRRKTDASEITDALPYLRDDSPVDEPPSTSKRAGKRKSP
ncbi:hypothetical protein CERSUDRAFT_115434 [Gelatoporia subvermispora B]|uniref:Velvet domain-containing protein n=1 Tax=Ceriporiopsis subvermispora (strain B) TaxID=914234 RepID=M2RCC0_CERS8|nr:hypothetical protein CERSUDRAFT_115434 [Gelatoporia subvermispora B]